MLVATGTCKAAAAVPSKATLPGGKGLDAAVAGGAPNLQQKKVLDAAAMASALIAAAAANAEGRAGLCSSALGAGSDAGRVRWPQMVLDRLASVALSESSSVAMVECESVINGKLMCVVTGWDVGGVHGSTRAWGSDVHGKKTWVHRM